MSPRMRGYPPRVLLVGYNGANNTGAEALLQADIADVRAVLGPEAPITVPTLSEANLRRYLREGPNVHIVSMPTLFPLRLRQLVREHDLILLVEGSAYMDTWTSALLWYFLWATRCARAMGKACLAYAVDAGQLSAFNQRLVRREASKSDLIITRARAAAGRLRSWGVTAPVEVTADNALNFRPEPSDEGWVQRSWPEAASGVVGLAVVDFYLWPVVVRPWGRSQDCYKWPYYYSRSRDRSLATEALASSLAGLADHIVETYGRCVALICMEQLDEPVAQQAQRHMAHADRARVFSSRQYNASRMTVLLRRLDLLVTSRYHASVLSLAAGVPQVALGHDLRLEGLYRELGLRDGLFVRPDGPEAFRLLRACTERLLANPAPVRQALQGGYEELLTRAKRNRELLRAFVLDRGWEVRP